MIRLDVSKAFLRVTVTSSYINFLSVFSIAIFLVSLISFVIDNDDDCDEDLSHHHFIRTTLGFPDMEQTNVDYLP